MEEIKKNVRSYIAQNILFNKNGYPYSDDTSLLGEGIIDSMNVLELVSFVEDKFRVEVNDTDIVPDNFDSVSKLSSFIRRKVGVPA